MSNSLINRAPNSMFYGYKVQINQHCTHSHREGGSYGSWEESYSNSIQPLIVKVEKNPDVVSIHDIKPGERGFVVWAEWSTGDSFGRGDRACVEAIGLFKSYEDAEVLREYIVDRSKKYDRRGYENDGAQLHIDTPDGQTFKTGWAPWLGYFEQLDDVYIDRVEVR